MLCGSITQNYYVLNSLIGAKGGIFMKKIWIIGCLAVLVMVFISFSNPVLAQSERKMINFNAG